MEDISLDRRRIPLESYLKVAMKTLFDPRSVLLDPGWVDGDRHTLFCEAFHYHVRDLDSGYAISHPSGE